MLEMSLMNVAMIDQLGQKASGWKKMAMTEVNHDAWQQACP